ncbi:hypothetical protein AB6A40_007028 [Gnathostoma spinigerum]|uniref:Uncharacterized protein n=1 Tax=Gnathostoma spinigerum TaxID=75299 RepID=A0ABD6EQ74_9BILA
MLSPRSFYFLLLIFIAGENAKDCRYHTDCDSGELCVDEMNICASQTQINLCKQRNTVPCNVASDCRRKWNYEKTCRRKCCFDLI